MAFTLSGGPAVGSSSGLATLSFPIADADIGDAIVIAFRAASPLRNVTSVTLSDNPDATVVLSMELFGSIRVWFAYLLNVTNTSGGVIDITITLDGTVGGIFGRAIAVKPPIGFEGTTTFDGETDNSSTSTAGSVDITTIRDESLVWAFALLGTGADPIFPGAGWTSIETGAGGVLLPAFYDLDTGAAGLKNVNWTQDSAFWAVGATAFSHDVPTSLLDYTGDGGAEANSAATIVDNTAANFNYTGSGGVEANSAATIVDNTAANFNYTGSGGVEANSAADALFIETNNPGAASFEALTAEGAGDSGTASVGKAFFAALTATGTAVNPDSGTGTAIFEALIGVGYGPNEGIAAFEPMTATGVAVQGGAGLAAFLPLKVMIVEGAASFQPLTAVGYGQVGELGEFMTKVVNLRTGAVSEFTNHDYNSFARIGTKYFAAGALGLVRLEGATDPSNASINWVVKTGRMDDKEIELKRLPEVVLGLRSNGKITVRVHPDENVSFDYQLPVVQKTTIHQHRVVPGKGMRSRWYAVELRGQNNATLELASMQVNMTKTTRRLG